MPRYKIVLEYDGGGFVGWQRQRNGPSVQEAVERAILGFSGERATVYGAGRTDAGVHALGQVAHFDLASERHPSVIEGAVNHHLRPAPIVVLAAERVSDDFHARLRARARVYLYRIVNRRAAPALDRGRAWHVPHPLDAGAMHDAAQALVGRHDFTAFRAAPCQARSPVKTLDVLDVELDGSEIRITARARSFLHHQVRNMVGTLKLVGEGKWSKADVARALESRKRAAAGPTAPAAGLYLKEVLY